MTRTEAGWGAAVGGIRGTNLSRRRQCLSDKSSAELARALVLAENRRIRDLECEKRDDDLRQKPGDDLPHAKNLARAPVRLPHASANPAVRSADALHGPYSDIPKVFTRKTAICPRMFGFAGQ